MARSLKDKLYLSGMDGQAAALARRWGAGYEITAFCYAPMLDTPETARQVRRDMEGVDRFWFHAPFAELTPCAIDPLVRQVAEKRLLQAAGQAADLGVTRMVCHGGFIPHVYYPEWYVEQSVLFWRALLDKLPENMTVALENVMEPSPETLMQIASGVDDPRLGLCLDVGHANAVSKIPVRQWLKRLAPRLMHLHLHDNDGAADLHQIPGDGSLGFPGLMDEIEAAAPEATLTFECMDGAGCARRLAEYGWLER